MRRSFAPLSPTKLVLAVFALCCLAYWLGLATISRSVTRGHVIGSDGLFYYEYLPSIFVDGDLDFSNQRDIVRRDGIPYTWGASLLESSPVTHRVGTPFAIGWAILMSPFFLVAHAIAHVKALFSPTRLDGYGFLYESVTNFGAVVWGCAGVWLVFAAQRLFLREWRAAMLALGVLGTSNLVYYALVQGSMSHAAGFFAISWAFFHLSRATAQPGDRRDALGFGLACGLAFLVRPQLALCVVPMFVYALVRAFGRAWLARAATACVVVGSIQLAVWHHLYGTFFTVPQGDGFLDLRHPRWFQVLFSLRHGLLVWHPMYLVCLLGLALPVRDLRFRVLALSCISLQIYINSCTSDWWAGNAFGNRRFIDILPLFAVGGAALLRSTGRLMVPAMAVALLTVWNLLFFVQYRFGYIPRGDPVSLRQLTIDKFRLLSEPRRF